MFHYTFYITHPLTGSFMASLPSGCHVDSTVNGVMCFPDASAFPLAGRRHPAEATRLVW